MGEFAYLCDDFNNNSSSKHSLLQDWRHQPPGDRVPAQFHGPPVLSDLPHLLWRASGAPKLSENHGDPERTQAIFQIGGPRESRPTQCRRRHGIRDDDFRTSVSTIKFITYLRKRSPNICSKSSPLRNWFCSIAPFAFVPRRCVFTLAFLHFR